MDTHHNFNGNSLGAPGDREGLADKDRRQSGQHGMTLLAHRGQITANATKSGCSSFAAEGACDLLLHFDHAQIAFGLIVGSSRQLHRLHL